MKFGYMIDSPSYEPQYLESSDFMDAVSQLEKKFDVAHLANRHPDIPHIELWQDKGIARKDMSFADLSEVYKLYPSSSGSLQCRDLCLRLWNRLCLPAGDLKLFSTNSSLKDVFQWLDTHTPHGIRSLIYGIPNASHPDPVYIPCEYISSWDGFGDVSSPAKYDPIHNKVYAVETAELTEDELCECEILNGEYMVLLGTRFDLLERSANDTWVVGDPDPLHTISGISGLGSTLYSPDKANDPLTAARKLKDLAMAYGFKPIMNGSNYMLCAKNTDNRWTPWITYNPKTCSVSCRGNTDHLNLWLHETRKDLTPENCLSFVEDLNRTFQLTGENRFSVKELIDPEDWQEIADIPDAHKDIRYTGYNGVKLEQLLNAADLRTITPPPPTSEKHRASDKER